MPKRPLTPPPGDDEPRYLTVCNPYPPHVNMERNGDVLALARWLACCMGKWQGLWAIFYKPTAPNMVIVEVDKAFPRFSQLLGGHRWSEFVKSPGEHYDKVTKIFFSTLASGRAVEKAGWKRIYIEDDWFKSFSPNNKFIAYPYPATIYCELPSEDQTGYMLCRPIPRDLPPKIQVPAPPVRVGSAGWIAQKTPNIGKGPYTVPTLVQKSSSPSHAIYPPGLPIWTPSAGSMGPNLSDSSPSPSPVSQSQSGGSNGGSSDYVSSPDDNNSIVDKKGKSHVPGRSPKPDLTDGFGTLSIQPRANTDGAPLCPTHRVICKKGICRDYYDLLKKIERETAKASSHNPKSHGDHRRGFEPNAGGFFSVSYGRGRGSGGARGSGPGRGRGRGSQRNTALASGSR